MYSLLSSRLNTTYYTETNIFTDSDGVETTSILYFYCQASLWDYYNLLNHQCYLYFLTVATYNVTTTEREGFAAIKKFLS